MGLGSFTECDDKQVRSGEKGASEEVLGRMSMGEAAAATALPPEVSRTDELLQQVVDELRACRASVEADIARHGSLTELMVGLHRLADLQGQLRQVAMFRALSEAMAEAEPEPEPAPVRATRQRARHAADRPLRIVGPGAFLPVGAAAFKLRWPSLHALAGHKALLTAGAGSALAASAVVGMHANHALPFVTGTGPGSWHAPAAIAQDAAPVPPSPAPGIYPGPSRPAGKHHKPVPAVVLTVTPPPQVPAFTSPGSSDPSTSSDSSDSSDPSLSPDLSLPPAPSADDGSGDGSKQERKQERKAQRKAERKLDRQLGDAADSVTGDLTGDGTGRHRRHDQDGILQPGDQGGQHHGRHGNSSGDAPA